MKVQCLRFLLGLVLASLLGGLAGGTPQAEESLVFPPYLESVVLDVFSDERKAAVEVFPPDAPHQPLAAGTAGVEEIRLGQVLHTLIIRRPAPGRWTFRKSRPTTRVKIQSQQFFPRGVLVAPASGEPLQQYDQVHVAYQVTDENGAPLRELPRYPLTAEVVLVQPGGDRVVLAMERQTQGDPGVFRTLQRVMCDLPGRYGIEVALTTPDLTGRKVKVLQDRWSGFWVGAAKDMDTF
ncbi:MAG TPA: hypothetical protein VF756_05880 [Thermoanaerobaculia bacterium]